METKKTIIISIITTLATLFVVATLVHLCGHCNKNSCGAAKYYQHPPCHAYSHCSSSNDGCSKSYACSDKSKCSKDKKCSAKKSCSKGSKAEEIEVKKTVEIEK